MKMASLAAFPRRRSSGRGFERRVLAPLAYAFHALGIVLASHGRSVGYAVNLLTGLGWFFVRSSIISLTSSPPRLTGWASRQSC